MKILGIETSCDETAAAVVEDGTKVLSNVISSQIELHKITGGVVPEVAAREHVLKIVPVIEHALKQATTKLVDIDAIAVTYGPGLLSSLIIGVSAANTLALATGKPLIPVNHIAGHIYANWLFDADTQADGKAGVQTMTDPSDPIQFPLVVLTVSGGHNELVLMRDHVDFELLGETLDDAAGEAFDKVARLLGLPYPGGPQISRVALEGDPHRFPLPKAYLKADSFDFSFSGLKTAVLNLVKAEFTRSKTLSSTFIADVAASFQEAVCEILSDKLLRAAQQFRVKEIHLAGGVSANRRLRTIVEEKLAKHFFHDHKNRKVELEIHPRLRYAENIRYCTDNAAMIAGTAYFHFKKNPEFYRKQKQILADPNLSLYQ